MKFIIHGLMFLAVFLPSSVIASEVSYMEEYSSLNEFREELLAGPHTSDKDSFLEIKKDISISIREDEQVIKVLVIRYYPSVDSAHSWGTGSVYFNSSNSRLIIRTAATLNKSGDDVQVSHVEKSELKVLDSDTYNTFTEGKELLVPYPNLIAGSYTVLEYEVVKDGSQSVGGWFGEYYPQNLYDRKHFSLKLNWQDLQAPAFLNTSSLVKCNTGANFIQCVGNNIPPAQSDETVFWQDELGTISYSSTHSWDDITKHVQSYFRESFDLSASKFKELSESLGLADMSVEQKISSLHQFISRDIRYLSRSENGHSVIPHNTSESLALGYGDCKDKSALLIELLNNIGIHAYPVLVNTSSQRLIEQRLASLSQFNHVIVCLEVNGKEYCLDGTDPYTRWDLLSVGNQGKYALTVQEGAKPRLLPIDSSTLDLDIDTKVRFEADGTQIETQNRVYTGHSASYIRSGLSSYRESEKIRLLEESYQNTVSSSVTPELKYIDKYPDEDIYMVSTEAKFDPFMDVNSDMEYYEDDAWVTKILKIRSAPNKHYIEQVYGVKINSTYEYDFGGVWSLKVPTATLKLVSEFGSMTRSVSYTEDDDKILVNTRLILHSVVIDAEKAESYNRFLDVLRKEAVMKFYGTSIKQ